MCPATQVFLLVISVQFWVDDTSVGEEAINQQGNYVKSVGNGFAKTI
jgi:hypothetical protein